MGVVVVGAAVAAGIALLAWRSVRRRWSVLRRHPLILMAGAVVGLRDGWGPPPTPAEVRGWTAPRARRRMGEAVARAEEAVEVAVGAGAAVAGLPGVGRRLRSVAKDLDRVLRVEARPSLPVRDQVHQVMVAADSVRAAAVAAAGQAGSLRVQALARDAAEEVACVVAGLQAGLRAGRLPGGPVVGPPRRSGAA